MEIPLDAVPLKARGQHCADAVHGAQAEGKDVEIFGLQVDGGQFQVKPNQPQPQRYAQVDERAGENVADRFAGLAGFRLPLLAKRNAVIAERRAVGSVRKIHCMILRIADARDSHGNRYKVLYYTY